jgi:hypothetical protein
MKNYVKIKNSRKISVICVKNQKIKKSGKKLKN